MTPQKIYRVTFMVLALVFIVLFWLLAFYYKTAPFSDFLYYWSTANQMNDYIKGGVLLFMYMPFKLLMVQPFMAATFINSLCFAAVAFVFYPRSKQGFLSVIALLIFGIWFAGFTSIVNSDLPHTAFVILSIYLYSTIKNKIAKPGSLLLFAFGISMRLQTALAFFPVLILFFLLFDKKLKYLLFLVFLILGVLIDISLSYQNPNHNNIILNSRAPLYTGILVSDSGQYCGSWTKQAVQTAMKETRLGLVTVLQKHFSPRRFASVITCKVRKIAAFDSISSIWLEASVLENKAGNISVDMNPITILHMLETALTNMAKAIMGIFAIYLIMKDRKAAVKFISIALCYFLILIVFEIQHRYMLALYSILLLFEYLYLTQNAESRNDLRIQDNTKTNKL